MTLYARLVHCYGAARAKRIILGQNEAANADLAAWNRLGKPIRTERP